MKKIATLAILALVVLGLFVTTAIAGAGDENYNGEDDEQPGIGVDVGPGDQNDVMPEADRTRNKD